jgi:hypothetical protein
MRPHPDLIPPPAVFAGDPPKGGVMAGGGEESRGGPPEGPRRPQERRCRARRLKPYGSRQTRLLEPSRAFGAF